MTILFDSPDDRRKVSQRSLDVITSLMTVAGVSEVVITSVQRSAAEQAHAMYTNCVQHGSESQFKLYGESGDEVVRVFVASQGKTSDQIIAAMTAKIIEIGPSNVSHHCAEPSKLNVIDISATRIPAGARLNFHNAIRKESRIVRFFDPFTDPKDPAFHIEIPQLVTA
jgi:hypothetical protein